MSKHTPGPWTVYKDGFSHTYPENRFADIEIRNIDHVIIASSRKREMSSLEHASNARLIAAAPDLLAALEALRERGHTDATWMLAERAIAKATGETP